MAPTTFASLGVPAPIAAALDRRGITEPFPIQVATIADALAGRDLCGKAPTGSGKTIAFGIPMVARVTRSAPKKPHGLVLTPTRELAIQVATELDQLGTDLRILAVYGGAGIEPQIKRLRAGADIVVATPGRLLDLMEKHVCRLGDVTFAVVDEADRMADMGFLPDVRRILDQARPDRQTVLFSATLDGAIDELVQRYQRDPVVHELDDESAGDISHHFWLAERPGRVALVAEIVDRVGHTVVFCRTKHGSDRVARQLGNAGIKAAAIHGNRSQAQRERALEAFHRGDVQALVATDVAARGIHVEGVLGVVHFDLPGDPKDYIHRSGRTGRAGSPGTVVALFDGSQRKDAVKLKKAAGIDAEIVEPDVTALPEAPQRAFRAERSGRAPRPGAAERRERSNRADRRRTQFTDAQRRQRAAAKQRASGQSAEPKGPGAAAKRPASPGAKKAGPSSAPRPSARAAGTPADDGRTLPSSTRGAAKVRPSGASRRKAKRAALIASGEAPAPAKRKRSGAPRPKPAGKPRRQGRSS